MPSSGEKVLNQSKRIKSFKHYLLFLRTQRCGGDRVLFSSPKIQYVSQEKWRGQGYISESPRYS